jgi:hypothetical protein
MKGYATILLRPVSAGPIRQPRAVAWNIAGRRGPLGRLQRFLISARWDKVLADARWIESACTAVLIASFCFFSPLLVAVAIRMNP